MRLVLKMFGIGMLVMLIISALIALGMIIHASITG